VTFANSLLSAFTYRKFFNKRATVLLEHNQQLSERLLQIRLLRGRFIDTDSVFIVFRCFRESIFLTFEYFIYYGSPYSLINMMTLKYILNFTGIALASPGSRLSGGGRKPLSTKLDGKYEVRREVIDETRRDETRRDETRRDETRQDKTRQDKTRQDKTRQDKCSRLLERSLKVCIIVK
jgi:hypothetical protein